MPKPPPSLPALGELELALLEHLWRTGESDVTLAHTAIGKRRGITLNTIGSTLERLFKKGLVARTKVSHAYRYVPRMGRDEFAARRVLTAAGGMQSLAQTGLLSAFVDLVADVDDAALDRLEALIADKRGSDKRGSDKRSSDKRGSDKRGSDNRSSDKRGSDNRSSDKRGSDNRGLDKRGSA
ncbi:MAG: BlaI/MecI/CopY family transcriptional regulator [Myxococcales bacterium]|nr:BlaI/MecI/CopY family transcriptional regulator [Myxococcales bacterium]